MLKCEQGLVIVFPVNGVLASDQLTLQLRISPAIAPDEVVGHYSTTGI